MHGTSSHAASAQMGRPCHSDAVQPAPTTHSIQSYSMESTPLEVRRNASQIMPRQPCGSAQFLLISWRHWRPTVPPADQEELRFVCEEGLAAFDLNYDQETEARRARRHTVTSAPASGPLHCTSVTAESAHPSLGCGVISAVIAHH